MKLHAVVLLIHLLFAALGCTQPAELVGAVLTLLVVPSSEFPKVLPMLLLLRLHRVVLICCSDMLLLRNGLCLQLIVKIKDSLARQCLHTHRNKKARPHVKVRKPCTYPVKKTRRNDETKTPSEQHKGAGQWRTECLVFGFSKQFSTFDQISL
jgi:hypothetical protein